MLEKKKSNKGLVILVIVLIILLLTAVGYICYEKGVFNSLLGRKDSIKEDVLTETTKKETLKYEDYKIVKGDVTDDDEYSNILIIKVNGNWYEVSNGSINYVVFGETNNKLYYADDDAFKYIDLSTKEFNSVEWIKYEEKCYSDDNELVGLSYADQGVLKDDTIYFVKDSFGWDSERDSYLYTLKLDATKYSDIQKEFKQGGIIDLTLNDNSIYYYCWDDGDSNTQSLKNYNLDTKESKTLYANGGSFILSRDKAIVSDAKESKWYLYDYKTGEKEFMVKLSKKYAFRGLFQFYNDAVYYLNKNCIMKYENGQNTKIYQLDGIREGGAEGTMKVINDNLFDYSTIGTDDYGYIYNGKKAKKSEVEQYFEQYKVKMKDGQERIFTQLDIE